MKMNRNLSATPVLRGNCARTTEPLSTSNSAKRTYSTWRPEGDGVSELTLSERESLLGDDGSGSSRREEEGEVMAGDAMDSLESEFAKSVPKVSDISN